ncbi:hypothetical protein C1H46_025121 [Malus baccata]|uniref:Uncharacterized protein n=1 Tax=Malus baccata TaxID=106549 RepID=A0A540LSN0_MALBA|nr:hypothetical protein C1H46_025121 [Malus baccata]
MRSMITKSSWCASCKFSTMLYHCQCVTALSFKLFFCFLFSSVASVEPDKRNEGENEEGRGKGKGNEEKGE